MTSPGYSMKVSLPFLLLAGSGPIYSSRRPPSDSPDRDNQYHSQEDDNAKHDLEDDNPYRALEDDTPYHALEKYKPYHAQERDERYLALERDQPYNSQERDQPYNSQERDQPYNSQDRDQPWQSIKELHSIQPNKARSPKSLKGIDCVTDETAYVGNGSTTLSGHTCQVWSADTPHSHNFNSVGDHNYCRNPTGYPALPAVWCYTTDENTRWEQCDIPVCVQSAEEVGCQPTDGTAYTGQANKTVGGSSCQKWSVNTPTRSYYPEVGEHNYCRNPDSDSGGLWCYMKRYPGWDYCEVPKCVTEKKAIKEVDCVPTDGSEYSGNVSITQSGRECRNWFIAAYTRDHNFCRQINGQPAWCYTTDVKNPYEPCDIPACESQIYTKGIMTKFKVVCVQVYLSFSEVG